MWWYTALHCSSSSSCSRIILHLHFMNSPFSMLHLSSGLRCSAEPFSHFRLKLDFNKLILATIRQSFGQKMTTMECWIKSPCFQQRGAAGLCRGFFVNDWSSTLFHHYNVIGQKVNHDKLIFYSQIDSKYLKNWRYLLAVPRHSSRCWWLSRGRIFT